MRDSDTENPSCTHTAKPILTLEKNTFLFVKPTFKSMSRKLRGNLLGGATVDAQLLQSVAWVKFPKGWSPSANLSGRAVEDGVKVNAVEGNVLQHGAHAQACVLENVVLANLKQPAVRGQATHCGLQLVICQRVERRIYTTSTRLCSKREP